MPPLQYLLSFCYYFITMVNSFQFVINGEIIYMTQTVAIVLFLFIGILCQPNKCPKVLITVLILTVSVLIFYTFVRFLFCTLYLFYKALITYIVSHPKGWNLIFLTDALYSNQFLELILRKSSTIFFAPNLCSILFYFFFYFICLLLPKNKAV